MSLHNLKEIHSRITASTKEVAAQESAVVSIFLQHSKEVDSKLLALQTHLAKYNKMETTDVNWGHVGDLGYVNAQLAEVIAFLSAGSVPDIDQYHVDR